MLKIIDKKTQIFNLNLVQKYNNKVFILLFFFRLSETLLRKIIVANDSCFVSKLYNFQVMIFSNKQMIDFFAVA